MIQPQLRALIVEDDVSWQQILSEILTDAGLTVTTASNLVEALHVLKSEPHQLAIVDLSLAGSDHRNEDGLQVLEAIRRLDPACRTILLTGFATVELAVSALTEYGAFTFLRKEKFNRSQFRELIGRALASTPAPENLAEDIGNANASIEKDASGSQVESWVNKVLVVEDDADWRSIISGLLRDAGHEVRLCASFGDALGCLLREKFILAIIDLSLSNTTFWERGNSSRPLEGYKLLANAKSMGIPTIVVSGVASIDEIQRVYTEHSVFAYLEKQAFDRTTFRRLVEEACHAGKNESELNQLTDREREVLDLLAKGLTNKEIAEALVITTNTVKRHIKAIFEKLEVHTRSAAAAKAISSPS